MLKPTKFSNPDKTVISISVIALAHLQRKRIVSFDELKSFICAKREGVESLLIPSLNFLYLLGVVEYREKSDSFEFIAETHHAVI